jgi:hypothetical protein
MPLPLLAAVGLTFFRTVNPAEADAFRACVVQDFERVAVADGDNGAGEALRRQLPSFQKLTVGKQATKVLFCEPSSSYGVFFFACCSPEGQTVP